MVTMTGPLQPLVKETWPLTSVHGPGLLASTHACMSRCVCVSEGIESGRRLSCLFPNPVWFNVMFYSSNNTSISYRGIDLRDIMTGAFIQRLSPALSTHSCVHT